MEEAKNSSENIGKNCVKTYMRSLEDLSKFKKKYILDNLSEIIGVIFRKLGRTFCGNFAEILEKFRNIKYFWKFYENDLFITYRYYSDKFQGILVKIL